MIAYAFHTLLRKRSCYRIGAESLHSTQLILDWHLSNFQYAGRETVKSYEIEEGVGRRGRWGEGSQTYAERKCQDGVWICTSKGFPMHKVTWGNMHDTDWISLVWIFHSFRSISKRRVSGRWFHSVSSQISFTCPMLNEGYVLSNWSCTVLKNMDSIC